MSKKLGLRSIDCLWVMDVELLAVDGLLELRGGGGDNAVKWLSVDSGSGSPMAPFRSFPDFKLRMRGRGGGERAEWPVTGDDGVVTDLALVGLLVGVREEAFDGLLCETASTGRGKAAKLLDARGLSRIGE
ncbi:hypothetical protein FRC15_000251 [Serendipita sp. 397]|nr:hypothetical protein FRC15_000251 [Serendipita sp. 397]